jgi:hypothetical protein
LSIQQRTFAYYDLSIAKHKGCSKESFWAAFQNGTVSLSSILVLAENAAFIDNIDLTGSGLELTKNPSSPCDGRPTLRAFCEGWDAMNGNAPA